MADKKSTCQTIEEKVVGTYKAVEASAVSGYKRVERGAVKAYIAVENFFVGKLFARDGETPEDAKKRLRGE